MLGKIIATLLVCIFVIAATWGSIVYFSPAVHKSGVRVSTSITDVTRDVQEGVKKGLRY